MELRQSDFKDSDHRAEEKVMSLEIQLPGAEDKSDPLLDQVVFEKEDQQAFSNINIRT